MADPIRLAAEARPVIDTLHGRNDVVVKFKTNRSGFAEDSPDALDTKAPGHFRTDKRVLTLNLDTLVEGLLPRNLSTVKDFGKHPVLAGVTAHESAHAKFSLWGTSLGEKFPEEIPAHDPDDPERMVKVSETGGRLAALAMVLEEPRIERLAFRAFSKTWRRGLGFSAGHLILGDGSEENPGLNLNESTTIDGAVQAAILIGGRVIAGTLGSTYTSRKATKAVMDVVQKVIEGALPDAEDPFHRIMRIIGDAVMNNDHTDPVPHLESARQILAITHPENEEDPDSGGGSGEKGEGEGEEGEGGGPGKGESGEGEEEGEEGEESGPLGELKKALEEALDSFGGEMTEMVRVEYENPGGEAGGDGYGSVGYANPGAPMVARREQPTPADRELYRRALAWMEQQVEPTVTYQGVNQWLPSGGARLDVRSHIRDNMAGHKVSQRSDWTRVSETVKPAPPVKVAIMLDASGSMSRMARPAASIAWAAANAAADLPESRTVSVAYGDAAGVTQEPGRAVAKDVAVMSTCYGTEDFLGASKLVEEALWLDAPVEEGEPTNVLIVIVSDLMYGGEDRESGETQLNALLRKTGEWKDKGYRVVVVGAIDSDNKFKLQSMYEPYGSAGRKMRDLVELVKPEDLFK